ncbi:RidA family protein [Corynebacterium bovis]|uniref:Enamine deaminase RidA (YjgF/YER057c/UK114 family) n=1 Tax=Corynebacterium bovis DSM 20582 = CIP 54.80 TaxID=927655 RepID=A0A8I0CL44_9CORY|nr:RidA family protein [Corynebacterium bovis]MBB3116202.1 enamine deaminase RidA (YjgF/YER057c/UK114 family) [Corynebacterium bovis DSM 20582 = CIP 54.80]MDK8510868.1 RidA family protein [Corynebacterium bovis]QQC47116.1 RidA family protein [Corynebacterium bovis]RRO93884.1 RidA family protein [Corynebacterium bovis]RRQ17157.1 RidA family protein [Corynebacterium bovis]
MSTGSPAPQPSQSPSPQLPSARLAELGLTLPPVAAPVAAYVPAVRVGDLVHTSGQLPFVDGALPAVGHVGDTAGDGAGSAGDGAAAGAADVTARTATVSPEQARDLARTAALNALAAVDALVGLDAVVQVVKIVGFVASAPGFGGQPGVVDGASTLIGEVFGDAGRHARSAVGVAELPLNSPVEIEVTVRVADAPA